MEEDSRKLDRTWLCSVLFLDIVNYSSQPVEVQVKWKAFFNGCLSEALVSVLSGDRIILDTGDGAVVCFLGDPEAALLASLSILNQFRKQAADQSPAALVRVGINLGPIRLIRDVNNQLNAVGDGINTGQRVMSFAGGNQMLISRSYYEVISTLSENYKALFRFDGIRHDKHVREHTVYALVQETGGSGEPYRNGGDHARAVAPSAGPGETQQSAVEYKADDLLAIERNLSHFVGPLAGHLLKKTAVKATSLQELCQMLAEGSVPPQDRALFLKRCRDLTNVTGPVAKVLPEPEAIAMTGDTAPKSPTWDPQFLDRLRRELAEYMGPIAGVLVNRAAKTATTPAEIYAQLAPQISSERERQRFLASRK